MSIGKDSITKRVSKPTASAAPAEEKKPASKPQEKKNIAPELVATVAAAPVPKKASTKKAPAASAKKKPEPKTAPKTEKKIDTAVLGNVSPETVKAVIGHAEDEKYEKVQIGQKMPDFLL